VTGAGTNAVKAERRSHESQKRVTQEITSNKLAIVGQSLAVFVGFGMGGIAVEYLDVFESSVLGRLAVSSGVPVAGIAVGFVGLAIAVTTAIDSWSFRIVAGDTGIELVERLGKTRARYTNIESLTLIPAYGAGIALKDRNEWLNGFVGRADNREKLVKISGVLSATYGCDIAFVNKRLKCGTQAFLDLLSSKTGLPVSSRRAA
jgi:hypothetical protein